MTKRTSFVFLVLSTLALTTACADSDASTQPDAGPGTPAPVTLSGRFDVHSRLTLAAPPVEASVVLGALAEATDDADDPSRFLVDLVIARLPEGDTKRLAQFLAPSIAAYVQAKLDAIAPRFVPGVRALAAGLGRLSTELGFREELVIDEHGAARRTLHALDVDGRVVDITPVTASAEASLVESTSGVPADRRVRLSEHGLRLDYSQLLRRGFDRGVIPAVVADAIDLGGALAALVDCAQLGAVLADYVGVGSPALYANACTYGLAAAAAELDQRLPHGVVVQLSVRGAARAVDSDRDGRVDTLHQGTWDGDAARGSFLGSLRAP